MHMILDTSDSGIDIIIRATELREVHISLSDYL